MKTLFVTLGLATLMAAAGCRPESKTEDVRAITAEAVVTPQSGNTGPNAWAVADAAVTPTTPVALNVDLVLKGMYTTQGNFYNGKSFNGQGIPGGFNGDEPRQCLNACPAYYSDIVCHYYCWQPSYAQVTPNIRGCFTQIARGSFKASIGQDLTYPQTYDYCTYQPFDAVKNPSNVVPGTSTPLKFDPAAIAANKASHTKPGVNAWVDNNAPDAFKHVMFTWYDPLLYTIESQQEVLNKFYAVYDDLKSKPDYGPGDTAQIAACQRARRRTAQDGVMGVPNGMECSTKKALSLTRHPNWAPIVAFMKSGDPSLQ